MAFNKVNQPYCRHQQNGILTPPSIREIQSNQIKNHSNYHVNEQERFQITETRIILTPVGKIGKDIKFSIWMPNKPIFGDDFILISRPMILTYENITSVFDLLRSQ